MRLLPTLTCLVWAALQHTATAQLSSEDARQLRLELAWQSQVQLPLTMGLASANLWAEESNPRRYAVVELPGRTIQISANKLDRTGEPIGIEAAKKMALQEAQFRSWDTNGDGRISAAEGSKLGKAFAEIDRDRDGTISMAENARFIDWSRLIEETLGATDAARMMRDRQLSDVAKLLAEPPGFEVKELVIPRIKLVLVSRSGSVEMLDAETGAHLWSTTCGEAAAPAFPAGVSKAGVSVVQGEHLYVLDWETGKQIEVKHLRYATSNAIAVTNNMAFVADFSGRIEAYGIGDSSYIQRWGYVIRGRAIGATASLLDKDLCAIASNEGFLYIFNATEAPSVWMRYQSSTPISRSIASANGAFYAGNEGGKLSKISVDDRLGRIRWEFLSGKSFSTPPLIVGSNVFIASESGSIYCVDDSEGKERWVTELLGISEPLAVVNDAVYCRTRTNGIIGLDINTGKVIGRTRPAQLGNALVNPLSNRVYLLGRQGEVECLRPIGGTVPVMVTPPVLREEATEGTTETPTEEAPMQPSGNPFEANPGNDPFGGGGADPFGAAPAAGADAGGAPAGGAGGAMANPFGADPFGAGNN